MLNKKTVTHFKHVISDFNIYINMVTFSLICDFI